MEKVSNFVAFDTKLPKTSLRADAWGVGYVQVIQTKDGYKLGAMVRNIDENGKQYREVCEIKLDDKNIPYVDVGTGPISFNSETCKEAVVMNENLYGGKDHLPKGYFVMGWNDGRYESNESVFEFTGKTMTDRKDEYFALISRYAAFNERGISLLARFVKDPNNKELLDSRIKRASAEEINAIKEEARAILEKVMNGEAKSSELDVCLRRVKEAQGREMSADPIKLDLSAYELKMEQQQDI